MATLLPTLITLSLLAWVWDFLWENAGQHLIAAIKRIWPESTFGRLLDPSAIETRALGVVLAMVFVYIFGFFVGNLIGRTFWKLGEKLVMKIPIVRAIYPAVKQVTDFVLAERQQFQSSRVVAVQPHAQGIWSIGLVTGPGLRDLSTATGQDMVTVFVPSSPTAFSGYVLVVPRENVVELPLKVEEAMRLLVSGGVIMPDSVVQIGGKSVRVSTQPPTAAEAPAPSVVADDCVSANLESVLPPSQQTQQRRASAPGLEA